ncbi:MAG: hypothetical protein II135_10735, partial [Clostridia bacterium]|nr:hypothetical protein [Clostridia bacterium]
MKVKELKLNKAVKALIIITVLTLLFVAAVYLIAYLTGFRIMYFGEDRFIGKIIKQDGGELPWKGTV